MAFNCYCFYRLRLPFVSFLLRCAECHLLRFGSDQRMTLDIPGCYLAWQRLCSSPLLTFTREYPSRRVLFSCGPFLSDRLCGSIVAICALPLGSGANVLEVFSGD